MLVPYGSEAPPEAVRGVADHLRAAEIADTAGMTDCGREIREILPRLPKGMIRYNNPYGFYTERKLPRCD